eukprot:TRINITY_DN45678_c0_g2_i1.p1 TRINITY_DN45678_c0_g2~~TRINITY_DN45678_c0_g2_i1.p1  ORF type:complete len:105 (-),score=1.21 TRINITY_DN45678_c0_g2_i1:129-443(-)
MSASFPVQDLEVDMPLTGAIPLVLRTTADETVVDRIGQVGRIMNRGWKAPLSVATTTTKGGMSRRLGILLGDADHLSTFYPHLEWVAVDKTDVSGFGAHFQQTC